MPIVSLLHSAHQFAAASELFRSDVDGFARLESWLTEGLRAARLNTKEAGDLFEVFAEALLRTYPVVGAKDVWPSGRIPVGIQDRLRIGSADRGIDGAYITNDDELGAYQVKFRSSDQTLSWRELSTFVGLSRTATRLLVITNAGGIAPEARNQPHLSAILGSDLRDLSRADLSRIYTLIRAGVLLPPVAPTPRPHQARAIDDIAQELAANPRATALMACGSGKTLVGLWVAERLLAGRSDARILVLLPSLALVSQTLKSWSKANTWGAAFHSCCVCSDVTVADGDEIELGQNELPIPVTTDSTEIGHWLCGPGIRVVFSTYQSSVRVQEAVGKIKKDKLAFDFAVCDEAHRTARSGHSDFTLPLDEEKLRISRRLFMTATRRVFSPKIKAATTVHSMDDVPLYGRIAHSLNFRQAADEDIICPYKVLISVVTKAEIRDVIAQSGTTLDGRTTAVEEVAGRYALSQAMKRLGLRKAFTFHRTVESAANFVAPGELSLGHFLPDFTCLHVSGAMRTATRESRMDEFKDAERGIVSNAKCLNEGIDVPAVDLVAFMDPKRSMIDIVQAIGRALRKTSDGSKTHGYILLPVLIDTAAAEDVDKSLKGSDFHDTWYVLRALMAQDLQLTETIEKLRVAQLRGRDFSRDDTLAGFVQLIGTGEVEDLLRASINVQVVEELGEFARCYARDPQPYVEITGIEARVVEFLEARFGQRVIKKSKNVVATIDEKIECTVSCSDSEKYIRQYTFFNAINPQALERDYFVIWSNYSRYGFIIPTKAFHGFLTVENSNKKKGDRYDWNVLTTYGTHGDFMKFAGQMLDVTKYRVEFAAMEPTEPAASVGG